MITSGTASARHCGITFSGRRGGNRSRSYRPYMLLELDGLGTVPKSLVLNPKAPTLLPRHETPRSAEAVEKLVRNLVKQKIVSFAGKHRLCEAVASETKCKVYER